MPTGISTSTAGAAANLAGITAITAPAGILNMVKVFTLAHPLGMLGLIGGSLALLRIYDALRRVPVSPAMVEPRHDSATQPAEHRLAATPEPLENIW